jgi:predicted nucleic acid-binding Zn ribbon protein
MPKFVNPKPGQPRMHNRNSNQKCKQCGGQMPKINKSFCSNICRILHNRRNTNENTRIN